jgi:hypothetical protein
MKRDFAAGVYLSEAQTPYAPKHTVYVYKIYLFTQGKGGKGEEMNQMRLWDNSSQKTKHDCL